MSEDNQRWWTQVDWPGAIACVLALGIAISMIMFAATALMQEGPISPQGASLLSTLFGAAIGAVATYLGASKERQVLAARLDRNEALAKEAPQ